MIVGSVKRLIGAEAFRFLIAGATNTLFALGIYWILLRWMSYPVAYTISFIGGMVSGFALNTYLVFRVRWSWVRLLAFPAVHAVNYVCGLAVVWVAVSLFEVDRHAAPVIAATCIIPLNFLMTRYVIKPAKHSVNTDIERPTP